MVVQQMLQDAYEHRHSLQEAEPFMAHGHAASDAPLLQSKCPITLHTVRGSSAL